MNTIFVMFWKFIHKLLMKIGHEKIKLYMKTMPFLEIIMINVIIQ